MIALVLALGAVCWITTTIICESELFRPLRNYVKANRPLKYKGPEPTSLDEAKRLAVQEYRIEQAPWSIIRRESGLFKWLDFLLCCPLCVGVWVGIAEAIYVQVRPGVAGFIFSALLYKAVGHLILELRPQAWKPTR